ncbi:MAG: DegT/DnrJ/EryC1/StrS family aminotransferase [Actinobacteria bacterium]|nr:DegT/DnrJ/EryC1/StrS family aminotransferase [Actinomycetota bacterium]
MRRAMAAAEVGDDGYGEDPTVNRLQELAAEVTGKDAALYVPSGTMANQLALRVLARPGTEVLCAGRAHVYRYEAAAAGRNAAVQMHPLDDHDGLLHPDVVTRALADRAHHLPPISLVCIENTHMPANGRPWTCDDVSAVAVAARAGGLGLHCDGARVFNASVTLGTPVASLVEAADTIMFCLSKGLGAPVGSVLCGSVDVIAEAHVERKRLGGAMRQAGVIAAAGVVALTTMVERLADDHARAHRLALALAELFPESVDPDAVRTNIVCCASRALPDGVLDQLRGLGVLAGTIDSETVRFMTHKDVDDAALERVLDALKEIAAGERH